MYVRLPPPPNSEENGNYVSYSVLDGSENVGNIVKLLTGKFTSVASAQMLSLFCSSRFFKLITIKKSTVSSI